MKWIKVETALPTTNEKFGDSEFCLVFNEDNSDKAVAWYNSVNKSWTMCHSKATSEPIVVTHWKLFKEPNNK